ADWPLSFCHPLTRRRRQPCQEEKSSEFGWNSAYPWPTVCRACCRNGGPRWSTHLFPRDGLGTHRRAVSDEPGKALLPAVLCVIGVSPRGNYNRTSSADSSIAIAAAAKAPSFETAFGFRNSRPRRSRFFHQAQSPHARRESGDVRRRSRSAARHNFPG